jgi:hypothetical protein
MARAETTGSQRAPDALSKHDGHPFASTPPSAACALCGESPAHILHHPTRIRAACALRGIDPEPLLRTKPRS